MSGPSLVTLVTPTYNQAGYLPETLDSVLAQTHPALEYLVIDDGSSDDTQAVMARYAGRLTALRQDNIGQARTLAPLRSAFPPEGAQHSSGNPADVAPSLRSPLRSARPGCAALRLPPRGGRNIPRGTLRMLPLRFAVPFVRHAQAALQLRLPKGAASSGDPVSAAPSLRNPLRSTPLGCPPFTEIPPVLDEVTVDVGG